MVYINLRKVYISTKYNFSKKKNAYYTKCTNESINIINKKTDNLFFSFNYDIHFYINNHQYLL